MTTHETESFSVKSTEGTAQDCVKKLFEKYKTEHKNAKIKGNFANNTDGTFTIKENEISNTIVVKIGKTNTEFSVSSPSPTIQKGLRNLLETSANIIFGNQK
jgi:hypothetical protein